MVRLETEKIIYQEDLSSLKTSLLFVFLSIIFGALFIWLKSNGRSDLLTDIFIILSIIFLFYVINYRKLRITLFEKHIRLNFGIFTWNVNIPNISEVRLDEIPPIYRYGGAGIHFMMIQGIYRISLNFLEYPRILITLKQKKGLVEAVSFSSRYPHEWIHYIENSISGKED